MIEKMLIESNEIFKYDDEVSSQYEKYGIHMLEHVNKSIKNYTDVATILGGNPLSLIEDNHKNHLQFMTTIIKYKQSDLLVHTLPWVYKAYSSKGVDFSYFLIELNQWIEAIKINIKLEYQQALIDIYQAMIRWHDDLIILSKKDLEELPFTNNKWNEDHKLMIKYLLVGDFRNILITCKDKLKQGLSISELYLDYIQPVMYKIGDLWEDGKISVAHEHLATSIVAQLIASLYPDYILRDISKGVAIMSAEINEYHQIGARIVADILECDGWDIRYLGANVPSDQLIELIKEIQPVFVALSMTMSYHVDKLVDTVKLIQNLDSPRPIKIMVGGLAINNSKELQHLIGADAYPYNANDSAMIATKWWKEYRSNVE